MIFDDAVGYGKTQSGSFSLFLGGEKRIKNFQHVFTLDAASCVCHDNPDLIVIGFPFCRYPQEFFLLALHGAPGVRNQIQNHLFNLFPVHEHFRQVRMVLNVRLYFIYHQL